MSTETMSDIKSRGFWRVMLRPALFQADRIPSLSDCKKLVADCKVSLRGWDYPHYDTVISGRDYIWSDTNWGSKKEVWRFYQSGQFANYFACPEDWWKEDPITSWEAKQYVSGYGLEVLMALFRLTEIYEFAARLTQKGAFGDELTLSVRLQGMLGRRLITLHGMLCGYSKGSTGVTLENQPVHSTFYAVNRGNCWKGGYKGLLNFYVSETTLTQDR